MDQTDLNLDFLLQETLVLTEFLRTNNSQIPQKVVAEATRLKLESEAFSDFDSVADDDSFYEIADGLIEDLEDFRPAEVSPVQDNAREICQTSWPNSAGIIFKIDKGLSTFCVRGFCVSNIKEALEELAEPLAAKRVILKLAASENIDSVGFFATLNLELAQAIREQVLNRRFPLLEDSVCNISDPGFSWWMNIENGNADQAGGKFDIFFRSQGVNRDDKFIQLGPIGDASIAALRLNQVRSLLRSSFPVSEFSCDDKCFTVASTKPDHLSFVSFKNIFLKGINNTDIENFPDNIVGRTLYYYFHELAVVRKFWIEVKAKLG